MLSSMTTTTKILGVSAIVQTLCLDRGNRLDKVQASSIIYFSMQVDPLVYLAL